MGKSLSQMDSSGLWGWAILSDKWLEKRGWYRFLRLIHILVVIFIILCVGLAIYVLYDSKTLVSAGIRCKDGTKWNAFKDGEMLGMYSLCGMCTKRTADNQKFTDCTVYEYDFDTYMLIDEIYKRNNDTFTTFVWPMVGGLTVFIIERLFVSGIIYVIAGKREDNSKES